jgi:hypothetical protein
VTLVTPAPPRLLRHAIPNFGLAALWVLTAAWMVVDALRDPFNPLLEGTRRYGHNHQGALRDGLVISLVELVLFQLLLWPWKGERSWLRTLLSLVLLLPLLLLSAVLTMHAGGILMIHLLWLLAVAVSLVVALGVSVVGAISRRRAEG